jgi:hypothetical protein
MIPLRFRILMRSGVQLVANSNSSARCRAVQTLIDIDETGDGSILVAEWAAARSTAGGAGRR